MDNAFLNSGETLILQVECASFYHTTYHDGILSLTDQRLHFESEEIEGFNFQVNIPLANVLKSAVNVPRQTVAFTSPGMEHRFRGQGAMHLHVQFTSEAWQRSHSATPSTPEIDFSMNVHASWGDMDQEATVLLESDQLKVFGDEADIMIDLNSETLGDVILDFSGQSLELTTDEGTITLSGPQVAELHERLLHPPQPEPVQEPSDEEPEILARWKCGVLKRLLLTNGELVMSRDTLTFTPTSTLERILGLNRAFTMPMNTIIDVELQGVLDVNVAISTAQQTQVLRLPNVALRAPLLLQAITDARVTLSDDAQNLRTQLHDPRSALDLIERAEQTAGALDPEEVLFLAPAAWYEHRQRAWIGHVLMTSADVLFLPRIAPGHEERLLQLRVDRLRPSEPGEAPRGELALFDGRDSMQLVVGRGDALTSAFWSVWRAMMDRTGKGHFHPQLNPENDNRRESYRASLPGEVATRIHCSDDAESSPHSVMNARMVDVSMGGCCLLTTEPIPEGVTMRLELPGLVESGRLVLAQRMNSATVGQFEDRWRHGVRFLDLTDEDLIRVQTIVMGLQRDSLTDRADRREAFQNPDPASEPAETNPDASDSPDEVEEESIAGESGEASEAELPVDRTAEGVEDEDAPPDAE
jgi:hypothetical protein